MKEIPDEVMEKVKLTDSEMQEYKKKFEELSPKMGHSRAFRTMMNSMRRRLLEFIGEHVRTMEEITEEFDMDEEQVRYHLSMLEQGLYLMETATGWKATPSGIGFLMNTRLS